MLTEQYKLALEQRLEEERAKMSEQLHSLEMDVLTRDDLIGQLREEISEQKRNKLKDANSGAQKTLEKLDVCISFKTNFTFFFYQISISTYQSKCISIGLMLILLNSKTIFTFAVKSASFTTLHF